MFYLPTSAELIQEFADTARTTTDRLLADVHRYGINPDDLWSEESLTILATNFLAGTSEMNTDELAMFIGEGRVRIKGGHWSLMPEAGVPLPECQQPALRITFQATVLRHDRQAGFVPLHWIYVMRNNNEPRFLADFMWDTTDEES
ncbi:MAG: hypothetical protein Q4A82_01255 [Corynebacterium sp.]|nr:hypothetical protein [Corynebacterium sp.]